MIESSRDAPKRARKVLGLQVDGDFVAFGLVPIACAVLDAVAPGPPFAVGLAMLLVCIGTAVTVARRRRYSIPHTGWYAFVAVLAFLAWGALATPLVAGL